MNAQVQITRIRVRYAKRESLRFIGHLDMQRLWERLLRRSRLPVRYSQGYHPRARLNLASALPLGFISDTELMDFWLNENRPLEEIQSCLTTSAPSGLAINSIEAVDLKEEALQTRILSSTFEVSFFNPQNLQQLEKQVKNFHDQPEIIRTRRKKSYDLKPLIICLEIRNVDDGDIGLAMHLSAKPGATGRPDEVLEALGFRNTDFLVRRTKINLSD